MSNVNYDPRKAHEYYMKHRKLKKRRSTKGFNQTQKEQWEYAKAQLEEQHDKVNQQIAANKARKLKELSEQLAKQREEMSERAQDLISDLRDKLRDMPKEQRALMKEKIEKMIGNIRSELKNNKQKLKQFGKLKKLQISASATKAKESEAKSHESRLDKAIETIRRKNSVSAMKSVAQPTKSIANVKSKGIKISSGFTSGTSATKKKKSKKN